jgi:hypothetical protein
MKENNLISTVRENTNATPVSIMYVKYVFPMYETYFRSGLSLLSAVLLDESDKPVAKQQFYSFGITCTDFKELQLKLFCSKHQAKKLVLVYNGSQTIPKPSYVISKRGSEWVDVCKKIGVTLHDLVVLSFDGSRYLSYRDAGCMT